MNRSNIYKKISRIERTHFRRRFSKTRFIEVVLWKFLRYRKLSLQYIQSNIFKVLEYKDHIPCCSGMIQKEVAERMAAPPGSKTYGILSVLLQAWYEIEYLFTVPEHVFNPPPKVKSAVIKMTRNQVRQLGCNEPLFKRIVKTAFNQRRKTMRNSLKSMVGQDCKILAEPIFNERPERLSVKQFIDLTNLLESYIIK